MNRGQRIWEQGSLILEDTAGSTDLICFHVGQLGLAISADRPAAAITWADAKLLRDWLSQMLEEVDEFDGIPV